MDEFFSNFGSSYLCFHLAAYCCALHTYNTLQPWLISHSRADVYRFLPSDLIDHIMCHVAAGVHTNWKNESQPWVNSLIQYHNRMADFAQGQLLRSLGKGVTRFLPCSLSFNSTTYLLCNGQNYKISSGAAPILEHLVDDDDDDDDYLFVLSQLK